MTPNQARIYFLEEDLRRARKLREHAPTPTEHRQASTLVADLETKIEALKDT